MNPKKQQAFTLIELLLVVLILAVLATLVVPRISESSSGAKSAKCDSNVTNLIRSLEIYAMNDDGSYPANQTEFNTKVLNNTAYFPHGTPTCPYSTSYTYDTSNNTVTYHSH